MKVIGICLKCHNNWEMKTLRYDLTDTTVVQENQVLSTVHGLDD